MSARLPIYALLSLVKRSSLWRSRAAAAWAALKFHALGIDPTPRVQAPVRQVAPAAVACLPSQESA